MTAPFRVAIVGRPNVGKSTLFNRLVGKKLALVDDTPGVTRDRRQGQGWLGSLSFSVIDTAGLEEASGDALEARMRRQTEKAVQEADVALFLIDARAGITPLDRHFSEWLRRQKTPLILVANKCEGKAGEAGLLEAFSLGLGEPVPLSAEHGEGLADLMHMLLDYAPSIDQEQTESSIPEATESEPQSEPERTLQLAIVGRPNAGKSTLVNMLIGEERLITGPEAGLTRDAIAVDWEWQGHPVRLVDTAGLRRKARVEAKLEKLAVSDSLRAVNLAQVVVLVIDALQGLDKQDLTIADYAIREGRALVIAVNKWDAVEDRAQALKAIEDRLERGLTQVRGLPLITLSAKTGRHLDRLMPAVFSVYEKWNRRISTPKLNRWLQAVTQQHPPPAVQGRRLRLRYATQIKSRPPTFAFFCSNPGKLPDSYHRYLANGIRETFDLTGIPVRIELRRQSNPFADE